MTPRMYYVWQIVLDELRKKQQETNAEGFAEELKELRSRVQTLIMQRDMMGMIDGADGTASPPAQSNLPMQIEGSGAEGERKVSLLTCVACSCISCGRSAGAASPWKARDAVVFPDVDAHHTFVLLDV